MEIGGYREIDLRTGNELYKGGNVIRLNAGRYGILHALKCLKVDRVLLPYYQCSTVQEVLKKKSIEIEFYHIDQNMLPIVTNKDKKVAVIIINYFGVIEQDFMRKFVEENCNVIIDNTQAFFSKHIDGSFSVYSPRKFVGVPDGAYVVGKNAKSFEDNYNVSISSGTSNFLLSRIETGANNNYSQYLQNEDRITSEGIRRMSSLTRALLDNIDYEYIMHKRVENYIIAHDFFEDINEFQAEFLKIEEDCIPMVYPLLIKNDEVRKKLKEKNIFVGQWWKYLVDYMEITEWERSLSKYLIPIQIDQRYGIREIQYVSELIHNWIKGEENE